MPILHILIIPPWFDIDFEHHYARSYHRWAQDLADMDEAEIGLLYGDFSAGFRKRKIYVNQDLSYNYIGVKGWGLPKMNLGWNIWERQYLRAFEDYVDRYGRPSVIHGYSLLGVIAAGAIHRRYGIPYTYTEVLGSFISGRVAKRLVRKATKAVQRASLVCGISPGMVSALENTFKVPAQLIPLYVDGVVFHPVSQNDGPPHFISIGAPARTKGMDILIEAMATVVKALPEVRLTIVDDIPEQSWLESLIRKNQLTKHITFIGAIPHSQIPGHIHRSHVLVSASRTESLGFTMLESLSCGRPVVATRTPGSTYIVKEGMGEIVLQEDPASLAKAMIQVYQKRDQYNPNELHEMISSQFGKEKILGEWMSIYLQLSNKEHK